MEEPTGPEDQRLLARARLIAVGVLLVLLSVVTVVVVIAPLVSNGNAGVDPAALAVVVPALSGTLLALFGIQAVINRDSE